MIEWIKLPGPGQIRGEGKWYSRKECGMTLSAWESYYETGYLPTRIQDTRPQESE